VSVRAVDVPLFQKLESLSGDLPELESRLAELSLSGESVWTEALYTGPGVVSDLREQLLKKVSCAVEILRVRTAHGPAASLADADAPASLEEMSVYDVFERRLDDLEQEAGLAEEQRQALRETYAEAVRDLLQGEEGDEECAS